jgi:GNAT superfamily N-acetyltransferase
MAKDGDKTMANTVAPFSPEHVGPAVELFSASYRQERGHSPLLPERALVEPGWIHDQLQASLSNPGVVVLDGGQVVAYMVTGYRFRWKGRRAALVRELGHGAVEAGRAELYQLMWMALAQEWADRGIALHHIGHFAHDAALEETLYHLGFGALLVERLRDCSPLAGQPAAAIRVEPDATRLLALQVEHNGYYRRSPIFLEKPTDEATVLAELTESAEAGDVFFVYDDRGEPDGYLIAGESAGDGEGLLLRQTNTAQVKSAYVRPGCRGQGVGAALLQQALAWARGQGYERLFVEHESANIYGSRFWARHFAPYVTFSMRYVDVGSGEMGSRE